MAEEEAHVSDRTNPTCPYETPQAEDVELSAGTAETAPGGTPVSTPVAAI